MKKIGIIGTGSVARYLAHRFAAGNHKVYLLSSGGGRVQSEPIRQISLKDSTGANQTSPKDLGTVKTSGYFIDFDSFMEQRFDLLLVCTKTVANPQICTHLDGLKSRWHCPVVLFQNGFKTEQQFVDSQFDNTIIRAVLNFAVNQKSDSTLHLIFLKTSYLGEVSSNPTAHKDAEKVARLLCRIGVPFEHTQSIVQKAFEKNTLNAAASVCGLVRTGVQTAMQNQRTRSVIQSIIAECADIGQLAGYVNDGESFRRQSMSYLSSIPDFTSSLVLDVINGKVTESETLLGSLVSESRFLGIDTPGLDFVYQYFDFHNDYVVQSQ